MFFILIIFIGCNMPGIEADISDTFNGFMAVPNLIVITLLSKQVVQMTKDYLERV